MLDNNLLSEHKIDRMLGSISFNCSSYGSDAEFGYFDDILESDFFCRTFGDNILHIDTHFLRQFPQYFAIELPVDIVVVVAGAVGEGGGGIEVGRRHVLHVFVELADAHVGDALADPPVPVHVVRAVELYA